MVVLSIVLGVVILLLGVMLYQEVQDNNELRNKLNEAIKENVLLEKQYESLVDKYEFVEEKYDEYGKELYEHDIIFNNLENDPYCLIEAIDAYHDVYNALINEYGLDDELCGVIDTIDVRYDRVYENKYNPRAGTITVSLFRDDDANEEFLYSFVNKNYGAKLNKYSIRTHVIFTVLHEFGHCIDFYNMKKAGLYDKYEDLDQRQRRQVNTMEYGPEQWKAYRQISAEAYADKWAIEFMREHFPELV